MGRLVYSMSVSLDGYVEKPRRALDWGLVEGGLHSVFINEAAVRAAVVQVEGRLRPHRGDGSVSDAGHARVRPHLEGQAEDRVLQNPWEGRVEKPTSPL